MSRHEPRAERSMDDETKERTYSEQELALILRRAVELQDRPAAGRVPSREEGFSLQEIQAIAREVGLHPDVVARAAATLTREKRSGLARVVGGAASHELEYTADREISPEEFAEIVDLIRKATGRHGEVNEVLGGLEWQTTGSELTSIHVTVRPRDGRTNVRIASKQGKEAFLTYWLSGVSWFILMGIAAGILEPTAAAEVVALASGAAAGAYVSARTIWSARSRKLRGSVTGLMRGLSRVLDRASERPEYPGASEEADGITAT